MTHRLDRRTLLSSSAAVGAGAALTATGLAPAFAATPGKEAVVLGGGMAGLTAAHELVERGFSVTVFEPSAWGGKARSIPFGGTGTGGRADLPGEHGFRFFPGFYHHVPDTMRRIPFGSGTVGDNLVAATGGKFLRGGDHADAFVFGIGPDPVQILTVDGLRRFLLDNLGGHAVPPHELVYFVERLLVFLTSCDERRLGQWEKVSWWDFVGAGKRSEPYRKILAAGLTRNLVAAKETIASTRTIGNMGEAFVYNIMGRGNDGALDRVLDLPTNEAWIDPWMTYLRGRGVRFVSGQRLVRYETSAGRITGAVLADVNGTTSRVEADWFVSAMPVEKAVPTLTPDVLALDPGLKGLSALRTDWMVGIQFFLRDHVDITKGHITFIDSPWSLTALTQGQFWADRTIPRDYGDGEVVDILSVDISNWDAPGILHGKTAKECTREEIAAEVLAQIKDHHTVGDLMPDGIVHSWFLDPGVQWDAAAGRNTNETPLLVNTVDSWGSRPTARTRIPNLLMSGDFVQTDIDLATMEGANESARHAVNAILDESRSTAARVKTYKLYDPPEFTALKAADKLLYKLGLRNALDLG
ncbi:MULTISPECIES: FAD-dependent oxidoreductase [unclassified Nocardioides]|uniref:hydroxysqualene dehydroxylase n=1 Tax=unclassified Nocardioides TaxID=2615069 RepID=UPI000702763A|nr:MULTISPECIES: FAD-dependent oxidoreductase [unclassified Nocardioides]KRC56801.1 FAD-dependent oxidoreductase [Nocardioides sp. Root79]KRC77010.1 FAD-dependent oxidoreductase [Nocardioides sp. Root240]